MKSSSKYYYFENLIRSTGSIAVVKLVAFYKEITIAATLSVGLSYDTFLFYLAAIGFPTAVLINAIQAIFIKKISEVQKSEVERMLFLESKYTMSLVFGLGLSLPVLFTVWFKVLEFAIPHFGFIQDPFSGGSGITVWSFLPYAVLSSVNIILYGYLQAKGRFLLNGFIQVINPLLAIVSLKVLGGNASILLLGISLGALIEFLVLGYFLRTLFSFKRNTFEFEVLKKVLFLSKGLIFGYIFTSIIPLIESTLLFSYHAGDISSYSFASKLPVAISSVIVTSAAIISLPFFSSMLSVRETRENFSKTFLATCMSLLVVGLAFSSVGFYFSQEILSLVFRSANFSADLLLKMGRIQGVLLFQVPFAVVSIIAAKALIAQSRNYTVSFIMIATSILHTGILLFYGRGLDGISIAMFSLMATIIVSIFYVAFAIQYSRGGWNEEKSMSI